MSNPPRTIRRDTRFFISAVTRELGSVRKLVKKALEDNDNHAVEQDNFPPDYRDLVAKLRERIDSCDAVVHIAGHCYGAEPPQRPADSPRRSYTQLEHDIAVELGKPVYVFLTGEGFPTDPHDPEPAEFRELQQAHRRRLTSTGRDYNPTATAEQLDQKVRGLRLKVERLEGELQQVDHQVSDLSRRSRRRFVLGSIALLSLMAIVAIALSFAGKKVDTNLTSVKTNLTTVNTNLEELRKQYADPDVLTGKIKSHIRKRADEEIAAARVKAPEDWRKRDEIEKQRDQVLERVEDLVETIRKGLAGEPDPIFVEAAEILGKQGVDEAITYLEQKQPSIEKKIGAAKSSRDQAEQRLREAYRPKILQADLYETSLKWDAALEIREEVARENPRWFDARNRLGSLLRELARFGEAELHLRASLEVAGNPGDQAIGINNLAMLLKSTNRLSEAEPLYRRALAIFERSYGPDHPDVGRNLNNLAVLLGATNRVAEAEPLMRRALAIFERSHGPDHPDVARGLNSLAELLRATNRVSEAEPLYRRALAIDERSSGPDHPNVAVDLNNLALLLYATNRRSEAEPRYRRALAIDERSYGPDHPIVAIRLNNLAALLNDTNRASEAEPLMRRSLSIDERSSGPDHPDVARDLSNLASLLKSTNRLSEAEPLYRRSLAIDERSSGPDHPDVARDLNNLAALFKATNRVAEAEPLMRRALAIFERSYGPDHPNVAMGLNNLARLLWATNRVSEAEPLMARHVLIFLRFQRSTGHEHPNLRNAMDTYRVILTLQKLTEPEIAARIKAASEGTGKLSPIVPDVDRLLGPAKSVADVLSSLNRQYKAQGKPAVYLLESDELIAPHLDELLRPNGEWLTARGVAAVRGGDHAVAVVLYEAALELMDDQPALAPAKLRIRTNRAASLRELGLVEKARDELSNLLPELEKMPATDSAMKARGHYQLALCQWRLGERSAAQTSAEKSIATYDSAPKGKPVDPVYRRQSEKLLEALKEGKALPPLVAIDATAALEAARERYRAREALTKLGLKEMAAPLLDQVLGPARPTKEVLEALDRQYREQGKSPIWFLPLNEPIAPHLDALLCKPPG